MSNDIDLAIEKYFPKRWTEKHILYFLKRSEYELDVEALGKALNRPISDFVFRGGKRIRPNLFFAALEGFGIDSRKYVDLGVAVELIHNATLILDDLEDGANLRRGDITCHLKFGVDVAVNAGFSLHVLPLRIVSEDKLLSDGQKLNALNIIIDELINVGFGQATDIYWHNSPQGKVSVEKYMEMVRLKTGSLMRMSLRLACVVAERDKKTTEAFSLFAENIGMAFQIIDDSLDLRSANKDFGKVFGNDITEGKLSLPVIYAIERASKEERIYLRKVLSSHTRDRKKIDKVVNMIEESGAVSDAIENAKKMVEDAWEKIEKLDDYDKKMVDLKRLAFFLVEREY